MRHNFATINNLNTTKGKGKVYPSTGRTAHRGSRGIAVLFLDHGTRRGVESASRHGRSLPPGKTRYSLYRRLGGPQGRSGQMRKISHPPGFDPLTIQPVASRYTDYATWPTKYNSLYYKIFQAFCRFWQACGNHVKSP